jgi:hypothetical protein
MYQHGKVNFIQMFEQWNTNIINILIRTITKDTTLISLGIVNPLSPSFVTRGCWLGVCNAIKDFRAINL